MKVFHLFSGGAYGGVERQIERLAAVFEQNGIEQRAMLAENPVRAGRLAAIGVIPTEMQFPGRFAFMDRRRINTAIRRFAPDIVISWTPDVAVLVESEGFVHLGRLGASASAAAGASLGAELHGMGSGGTAGGELAAFARCDRLFTPAAARADAAKAAGWAPEKLQVLPHLPRLEEGAVVPMGRKPLYTPPTAKLIVTALRLTPQCGLDLLLDAVARLSGYYLWIAGDGSSRAALEQLAHDRGVKPRVRFLGWQDDLTPYLSAADVFVYPAKQEDVADAVIEAWSVGAAVIAADSMGPGLLVRHQENGVLVPVGDTVSMAEAIKWICQDAGLARRLGETGRTAFAAAYAPDKVVPQYLDFFRGLAAKPAT